MQAFRSKTAQEELEELHDRARDLRDLILKELGIDRLALWLSRRLR